MDWLMELDGVDELQTAEDFLTYFGVPFAPERVKVIRLHLMHRFHEALSAGPTPATPVLGWQLAHTVLAETYQTLQEGELAQHSTLRVYRRLDPFFVPFSALQEVCL